MNCNEFNECVCEIVDKRLSEERTKELLEHASRCPHCQYEYDALRSTKTIVHEKLRKKTVPAELYYAIVNATVNGSGTSWMQKLFGIRVNPAVALVILAAAAIGIYSLFIPGKPASSSMPEEANIISQSLKNYQAVIGGAIKPTMIGEADTIRTYLEKEVAFAVNVPNMPGCSWCGGVLSEFKGTKLAHVVFGMPGKKLIYIYQVGVRQAMEGKTIGLPEEAKQELARTDWYIKEYPDSTTLVVWKYKTTLCAAVSKMQKDQLIALLTEKNWN